MRYLTISFPQSNSKPTLVLEQLIIESVLKRPLAKIKQYRPEQNFAQRVHKGARNSPLDGSTSDCRYDH